MMGWIGLGDRRTFQQYLSYIMTASFIGGGNRSTRKKNDIAKVTDKLYHIILYREHLAGTRFELTTLLVIGTDGICSNKSTYHEITTTTAPCILDDQQSLPSSSSPIYNYLRKVENAKTVRRRDNEQRKKNKMTNNDLQNITQKT